MTRVGFTNPLQSTLRHFSRELQETLLRSGCDSSANPAGVVEGLTGATGRIRMLARAFSNISTTRRSSTISNIQLWPSIGLLELPMWRATRDLSHYVILHDPIPLRRQPGFDLVSAALARRSSGSGLPTVIVHSRDAETEARRLLPNFRISRLLHPVLSSAPVTRPPRAGAPRIVVAGQYKPGRDLELLRQLGPLLAAAGIEAYIHGRGWPADLPGWTVDNRFMPEEELDRVLVDASVVLLPYKNYFQSGIAVRALELGTLSITARNSFAEDLFGDGSGLIYDESSADAVLATATRIINGSLDAGEIFTDYRRRVDESWGTAPWAAVHSSQGSPTTRASRLSRLPR